MGCYEDWGQCDLPTKGRPLPIIDFVVGRGSFMTPAPCPAPTCCPVAANPGVDLRRRREARARPRFVNFVPFVVPKPAFEPLIGR